MRGIHILGSSIAGYHISKYFLDREFHVTMEGIQSEKFTDKIYLVRDQKRFNYACLNSNSNIKVESPSVVYIGEDIVTDLDNEFERFVNFVEAYKDKRFFFTSTDLVYGQSKQEFREDSPLNPNTPKGEYYVKMEKYLKEHHDNYIILRTAEIFGEGIYSNVYEMCKLCIEGKDFEVNDNKRDFTFIDNLCEIIQKLLHKKKITNEVFNIANEQPVRYVSLGNLIASLLGEIKKKPNQVVIPVCSVRINDDVESLDESNILLNNTVIDVTKLKKKLRYEPTWNNITTILIKRLLPFHINNLSDISQERKIELINRI